MPVALVGSASAAIIASDDFSYADGALSGQNGGTGWATAWADRSTLTGNAVVDAGDAVTSGVATVFGDNSGVFDDQGTTFRTLSSSIGGSGDIWLSIDMSFTSGAATDSFVSFQFRNGAPPATGDPTDGAQGAWRIGDEWTGTNWAVSSNSTGASTTGTASTGALDTLLVHIDYTAGTSSLWINAADGTTLGAPDASIATTPGTIDTVLLRAGGGGGTYRELSMDNLVIGTLESDVRIVAPVPEPFSAALLGLGGLALILRRRK